MFFKSQNACKIHLVNYNIFQFGYKNAPFDGSDDRLDGIKKNPYRFNVRKKLMMSYDYTITKLQQKTSLDKVRKVSSKWCCIEKWVDNLKILSLACNWDHIRVASNHVQASSNSHPWLRWIHSLLSPVTAGVGCWPTPSVVVSCVSNLTLTINANQANAKMGLHVVSQSIVSQIKSQSFGNVHVKPAGSNFSKCTECDFLCYCILKYPKDCPKW